MYPHRVRALALVVIGIVLGVTGAWLRSRRSVQAAPASTVAFPVEAHPAPRRMPAAQTPPVRQRDLATSDPRYDPVALLAEANGELDIEDIIEREPRDPASATFLEDRARALLTDVIAELHLDDRVRAIHVECRTLGCVTRIEVAPADVRRVYDQLNGVMLGDAQSPGEDASDPEVGYVTMATLFRPVTRDPAYYAAFVAQAVRPAVEWAKERAKGGPP